jgi:MFS transporter, FSR family, fosmidomycin resistance protein
VIGLYTDRHPKPYSLAAGMTFSLIGLLVLSVAHHFALVLLAAATVGLGSAVFHPESSRIARLASGGRHGFAQSLFQVGGNAGSSLGPLLAAFIVLPRGQASIGWFSIAALGGIVLLWNVGTWYKQTHPAATRKQAARALHPAVSTRQAGIVLAILLALIFSKYVYLASLSSYYTFYLIEKFNVSVQSAQVHLFIFLGAVAAGTILGGPIGDRVGRRVVILWSILGVLPFTLALPYANLFWTEVLSILIGVILASAFSAIVVYAQELVPGRVGMIAGLFFGLAFGIGGLGAAVLGVMADRTGIEYVFFLCSFLPLIGILAVFLPNLDHLSSGSGTRPAAPDVPTVLAEPPSATR